jgi:hypothetical protein
VPLKIVDCVVLDAEINKHIYVYIAGDEHTEQSITQPYKIRRANEIVR